MALIRYFFGDDYTKPSDDFFRAWGQLQYALEFDGKIKREVINFK